LICRSVSEFLFSYHIATTRNPIWDGQHPASSCRCAEQERPVPGEIGQMSAADAAQGQTVVNAERVPIFLGELG